MNPSDEDARRLIDLLSRGWDGVLTDADNEAINAFLRENLDERSELLLNISTVHLETSKQIASAKLLERAMGNLQASLEARGMPVDKGVERRSPARRSLTSRFAEPLVIAAIAACVMVALGTRFLLDVPPEPSSIQATPRITRLLRPSRPVARVVAERDAIWAEGSELMVGQTISENSRLVLLSGSAQLSMACGADIVMQAPCELTLLSQDMARLDSGKVTAQVAEEAKGFAILAKDLRVADLGSRFALSSDPAGVVEAHVLEGSVLAEPLKDRRPQVSSVVLKSGEAIRVNTVRSRVDLIDARQMDFADALVRFRPLRPIQSIWNTGIGAEIGSEDPRWTITGGSDALGPYPRKATIQAAEASYEDNKPGISQWISLSASPSPGAPPDSVHTFETTFDLEGYDLSTVYVVGYFLVDDAINELRINGHPVHFNRWMTTWDQYDFKSFHAIEITDHFVEGRNTISIDLYNSPSRPESPDAPNPTALRVEWQAFGCDKVE
ncbi:hypothetical protein [Aeoliella sp. SH292]|uniref:hypothetical protein n=1 Tax=Aeoliella sp. SH292 TaxID=3454464 RepID=UPI003F9D3334